VPTGEICELPKICIIDALIKSQLMTPLMQLHDITEKFAIARNVGQSSDARDKCDTYYTGFFCSPNSD